MITVEAGITVGDGVVYTLGPVELGVAGGVGNGGGNFFFSGHGIDILGRGIHGRIGWFLPDLW